LAFALQKNKIQQKVLTLLLFCSIIILW